VHPPRRELAVDTILRELIAPGRVEPLRRLPRQRKTRIAQLDEIRAELVPLGSVTHDATELARAVDGRQSAARSDREHDRERTFVRAVTGCEVAHELVGAFELWTKVDRHIAVLDRVTIDRVLGPRHRELAIERAAERAQRVRIRALGDHTLERGCHHGTAPRVALIR
jgi:hypothetical protein